MTARHPEYQYLNLAQKILDEWVRNVDLWSGDVAYALFGAQIRFDLSQGIPLLTTKKVYWKWVVAELLWFLHWDKNIEFLVKNNVHIWDDYPYYIYNNKAKKWEYPVMSKDEFIDTLTNDHEFAQLHGNLENIYWQAWRDRPTKDSNHTVDQIAFVLRELAEDPDARNAIVTSWNPEYMYTMAKPGEANKFPICHALFQFSIKNNKLSCQLYQRSADLFLWVPFNIASYSLLTYIMAHLLGVEVGEFVHTFGDVHIYESHMSQMKEQLTREPKLFPTVKIDSSLTNIDDIDFSHITLEWYDAHPPIKAQMAMVGGMVGRDDEE